VTEATQQPLPTVTRFVARRAAVALRKRNLAVEPLLRRAGISQHDFDSRQNRISAAAESRFLKYAAEALGDNVFGLRLAEAANPREAGLLFYVVSASKDLSEALAHLERYFRIVNEAVHLQLRRVPDGVVAEFSFTGLARLGARQNVEFGVAIITKALREIVGRNIRPMRVTFAHPRNSHLREFERFYRCPVEFSASSVQLSFSRETLALPLVTEDPYLLEALRPLCEEAARERRTAPGSLRSSVENEVQKLLPHGTAERRTVAKALGMSTRTLARRLAEEGTTFEDVVDRLRQSLALQYIKDRELSLSQIAWLIGYGGSTSLNHAFRRWTGRSPSAMRSEKARPALG
jgi:AraC-like DNA-binding protein